MNQLGGPHELGPGKTVFCFPQSSPGAENACPQAADVLDRLSGESWRTCPQREKPTERPITIPWARPHNAFGLLRPVDYYRGKAEAIYEERRKRQQPAT